jgi:hypothetical protein
VTAVLVLLLWCVLPAVIGAMRAIVLRVPDPATELTLRTVSAGTRIAGSSRGRREG